MFNKFKSFFKLNNWKRVFLLIFSFVSFGLFIGLSFGLFSKNSTPSSDYRNGIQVTIKPINQNDGTVIVDERELNEISNNLSQRLEAEYPDQKVEISYNEQGVINLFSPGVDTEIEKNDFLNFLVEKEQITITGLGANQENISLISDAANTFTGVGTKTGNAYSLQSNTLNNDLLIPAKNQGVKQILIWRNFKTLMKLANLDDNFNGDYYSFLFEQGYTPEDVTDSSTKPVFLKKTLGKLEGVSYSPLDFLISKNNISSIDASANKIDIDKNFGTTLPLDFKQYIDKEYTSIRFSINSYQLNNYLFSFVDAKQGNNAQLFLLIGLVTIFAVLSLFVVLNYGYLGIIAILILGILVFLSMLMITVFIGDYDTTTISSLVLAVILAFDFMVLFFERVKREIDKGNSIPKSIKNSISKTNKSTYAKSAILILSMIIFYVFLSNLFGTFSLVTLSTILFLPLLSIFLLRALAYVLIDIDKFKNDGKVVGMWRKKIDSQTSEVNVDLLKQIEFEKKDTKDLVNKKSFKVFSKFEKKGVLVSLVSLSYVIFGGLAVFLTSFFSSGQSLTNSLNLNPSDKNAIVLRIGKTGNVSGLSSSEIKEIKTTVSSSAYNINLKDLKVTKSNLIEIYLPNDFSKEKINQLSNELALKNVIVIPSIFKGSQTFKIMLYTMYGILAAIIAMGIFILLWMNWTKALTFILSALVSVAAMIGMAAFGFITITPYLSIVFISLFMIMLMNQINLLIRFNAKLKTRRLEEVDANEMRKIIKQVTFNSLKPLMTSNLVIVAIMLLLTIFIGSLPWQATIFIMGFVIVNFVFTILLLPRIFIFFENIRARSIRKKILNKYWETEKVKEQIFQGFNNIK